MLIGWLSLLCSVINISLIFLVGLPVCQNGTIYKVYSWHKRTRGHQSLQWPLANTNTHPKKTYILENVHSRASEKLAFTFLYNRKKLNNNEAIFFLHFIRINVYITFWQPHPLSYISLNSILIFTKLSLARHKAKCGEMVGGTLFCTNLPSGGSACLPAYRSAFNILTLIWTENTRSLAWVEYT